MIWIDERGRIVRPNDIQFGTDLFVALTGRPSEPFLAAVRAWVREGTGGLPAEEIRTYQVLPTREQQAGRAEFTLAWHLHRAGQLEAAERHFRRAGELAPGDWTIRRGVPGALAGRRAALPRAGTPGGGEEPRRRLSRRCPPAATPLLLPGDTPGEGRSRVSREPGKPGSAVAMWLSSRRGGW